MFSDKTLPASPAMARRLLRFAEMSNVTSSDDLVRLAGEDLLLTTDLPWSLEPRELQALQHVCDWRGRAMLLCEVNEPARRVALMNVKLRGGRTLILCQPKFYHLWAQDILEHWPEANISIFGNPRYQDKASDLPAGMEFRDSPDLTADFFITSYGGLIWHDLLSQVSLDQSIIEELDNKASINHKWQDALKGIFHEMPSPLFIQNINNLPNDPGRDNLLSLQIHNSRALEFLSTVIGDFLWSGIAVARQLSVCLAPGASDYLEVRGYKNLDSLRLLESFGASGHLLADTAGRQKALTFHDQTVRYLVENQHGRTNSALYRFIEREQELADSEGQSIESMVVSALGGSRPSATLLGRLMTTQWANLKAQHIKAIHGPLTTRSTRSLFLVNHADLKRALMLQFSPVMEDQVPMSRDHLLARFLYPEHTSHHVTRPLLNVQVTLDDLIEMPQLLKRTNFLFICEPPLDRESHEGILAASALQGTRVVQSVLNNTFEEDIFNNL